MILSQQQNPPVQKTDFSARQSDIRLQVTMTGLLDMLTTSIKSDRMTTFIGVDEEGAPHFHLRQVYVAHDRDGHAIASKDKALKEMGINLPDPSLLAGRANNRKMTYTSICRARLQELARASGLEIETEPREVSRSGRRLADYQAEQARQRAEQAHGEAEQAQTLLQETRAILDRLGDTPALTEHILALEAYLTATLSMGGPCSKTLNRNSNASRSRSNSPHGTVTMI